MTISHRFIETNGIRMHLAEAGSGPTVLLCHGFPECWYSWRHQLEALAAAGYRAIAPDMRGYGQTDKPDAIDQYTLLHLTGDMVGLLDAIGTDQAVVVGHDWGAPVAWRCALFRPDRFRAVVGLSVPFQVRGPNRPSTVMPRTEKQRFYQLYSRRRALPRQNSKKTSTTQSRRHCSPYLAMRRLKILRRSRCFLVRGVGLMGSLQPNHCRRGSRTVTSNFTLKSSSAPALEEV